MGKKLYHTIVGNLRGYRMRKDNKITRKNIRGEFFPYVKKDFYKHDYTFMLVKGGFICNATKFFVVNKKVVGAVSAINPKIKIKKESVRWHNELQRAIRMIWGNRGLRNQLFGL